MSSLMDKNRESRSKMFLRSNSFQKLCSLAHPMRLRGFKSNREALRSVFESLIVTTRGVIQSVTYRILGFLFLTPFTRLLSRPLLGLVDAAAAAATATASTGSVSSSSSTAAGKDGSTRLNTVRLILKLTLSMIISTDKTDASCDNEPALSKDSTDTSTDDDLRCSSTSTSTTTTTSQPTNARVDTAVQTEDHDSILDEDDPEPDDIPVEQFFDCKDASDVSHTSPISAELAAARQNLLHSPRGQLQKRPPSRTNNVQLWLVVYGCVLCCLGQLSALAYMLNAATTVPPGLIFLISALAYIGYVLTRILFYVPGSSKGMVGDVKGKPLTTSSMAMVPVVAKPEKAGKGLHPILEAVCKRILLVASSSNTSSSSSHRPRMSRSATRTRVLLCADDKTISKMKIL